ncbi:M13 family peptidase [Flavobacteriaceae bacterium Ap0902]|nr:M13 family peptidase [Flavobacteriaceae bacterium Ap0902]
MKKIFLLLAVITAFTSCKKEVEPAEPEDVQLPNAINLSYMDTLVRPQDDFYNFVNGNWMKETEIPSDRGRWGSFDELREFTDSVSLKLLDETVNKTALNADEELVANLYQSITDTIARNNEGINPIKTHLDAIEKINNLDELNNYLTQETAFYGNPLYGLYVRPHMKNSNLNVVYLSGPSLGMSRDYYQKEDEDSKSKLNAYQGYLKNIFSYINDENPETTAADVVNFEKEMASHVLSFENLRNSDLKYNPVATEDLKSLVSGVDLSQYLQDLSIETDTLIIPEIKYYRNLSNILTEDNLPVIKKYLTAHVVNDAADQLNADLEKIQFEFYSKELKGIEEMRPLDKRALSVVNNSIGQAFGKSYVAAYFPEEAKEQAEEMVRYIRKSFENHLNELTWMTDSTKTKALNKLQKFNVKIGYPDNWKDYDGLSLRNTKNGGSFYDNMRRIASFNFKEDLDKIGEEVDKSEWFMPPQMVNAYYSPQFNEIVFPAAILQPPFYNFKADAAVNFGGMGAVIGHEISHGFDDSGAKYDGDGNLNNWWTSSDEEEFSILGENLAAQYSAYEPLEGIFVNGKATLGENIADLGGLNVAFDGLQMYLKDKGNPGKIDGFTPEQRFFISWATIWRTKSKDEALKNQVKSDFHSPGYYRAIGPLENIDAFYDAFNVTSGDKMFKPVEERTIIW